MEQKILTRLALSFIPNVGRAVLRRAREAGLQREYANMSVEKIEKELRVKRQVAERIKSEFSLKKAEEQYTYCKQQNIEVMMYEDERYSDCLREIPDPPEILYGMGNTRLLSSHALSIVGTRTPTIYGKKTARAFSKELSEKGMVVVSGLARGIDGEAHRGALEGTGETIAVLGCGVDQIYPNENKEVAIQIKDKGLILSEYPPGMQPHRAFFPERNRIISGLSLGTIVIEAASRSGSHITADMAGEQGRDVFAVPGSIYSPKSAGCHYLIQQGAKLVQTVQDVLEEYPHIFVLGAKKTSPNMNIQLTIDESLLLQTIPFEPISYDELLHISDISSSQLPYILLSLQVKKCIIQMPGQTYMRVHL